MAKSKILRGGPGKNRPNRMKKNLFGDATQASQKDSQQASRAKYITKKDSQQASQAKYISKSSPEEPNLSDRDQQPRQSRQVKAHAKSINHTSRIGRIQAVTLAVERHAGYRANGRLTPYRDLKALLKDRWGIEAANITIGRWIAHAFAEGWVETTPVAGTGRAARYTPDLKMTEKLLEKFRSFGLLEAIVIDIEEPPDLPAARPEDPFYQALGLVMAQKLKGGVIRPHDVVGIGSGRACYNAVTYLKGPLPMTGLSLMSLTGRVWSRPDPAHRLASWMDSDYHLSLFLNQCTSAEPFYIGHPLTYPAMYIASRSGGSKDFDVDQLAEDARKNTSLGAANWKARHPTVAILGCGTVLKNHRFWVDRDSKKETFDPLLQPVFEDLKNLVSLFENDVTGDYSPVADTSNHLFFVPHPDPKIRARFNESAIKKAITELNKKLLSVSDDQFSDINSIALIGGTAEKAYAIRELLMNRQYKITVLCTDSAAATKLLGM